MTSINVGDTVRHNTRPDITGTVTSVAQLHNRVGVYIAGQRGAYNPDDLTIVSPGRPRFKPGDRVRRIGHPVGGMKVGSEWTVLAYLPNVLTVHGGQLQVDDGSTEGWYADRFELVAEPQPEPGTFEDAVQKASQAAAVDALAAIPVEAVLAGDDGWWDVPADGDGEWHIYPGDAAKFGLEVRVQVRKACS